MNLQYRQPGEDTMSHVSSAINFSMPDTIMQAASYVNDYAIDEYLDRIKDRHPELFRLISRERRRAVEQDLTAAANNAWEFEDDTVGGRGLAYNVAQKCGDNRRLGMTALLKCFSASSEIPTKDVTILDVLGGDGTLARFCQALGQHAPTIFTADISKFMIDACFAQALPCLRQSATTSMFQDGVLDGVLIAYGSHHLDSVERHLAAREAHRTLKTGGRLVLHDFEIGGRSANWFDRVVHPYSRTGHPHAHFSRAEMFNLFADAGFGDVRTFAMDDSFTLHGGSPEEARHNAIMHLYEMYDLVKISDNPHHIAPLLDRYIAETLGPISIAQEGGRYVARIPRDALVTVGTKAGD